MLTVVGFEKYSFTPKEGSQIIHGYTFYCTSPINEILGQGVKTIKFSLSESKIELLPVSLDKLIGKQIEIYYNMYRKPEFINLV